MIRRFEPGKQASASHLNELVEVCNAVQGMRGDGLVQVNRLGSHIGIGLAFDVLDERISRPSVGPGSRIRFGKPTGAYSSGATITLDPCDINGVDSGAANVTVQAGWTLPANTNIPTSAIVPYLEAADGNLYVVGQPREVVTNIQYDTTSHKIQKKVRYDFGVFSTTESSAWVDVTTAVDCTA